MSKVRKALLALAAAVPLVLGLGAGTGHANPPPAGPQCRVDFVSLTATTLWHNNKDWIWFVIDGDYYPGNTKSIDFLSGTTQKAGPFNSPSKTFPSSGSVTFQVVLDRTWPTANLVIDSNTVSCATVGSNLPLRFSDGTATYDLLYNARIL